jgi:hypothetical protein
MDVKLIICTAFYAAGVPFRWLSALLGVPASPTIESAMGDIVPTTPLTQPGQRTAA